MKTQLIVTAMLVTGLMAVAPASAYGACFGYCTEVTTETHNVTNTHVQTCAGNFVVQVGVSNNAEFCNSGGSSGTGVALNLTESSEEEHTTPQAESGPDA